MLFVIYLFILVACWTSNNSLVDTSRLISNLTDWLVLDDKVCEPSTNPNPINLSNSIKNNVYIVLFDMVKK